MRTALRGPSLLACCPRATSAASWRKRWSVSRQNDFALLDGIGGECAGAVTLLEPGQTPSDAAPADAVRWLDDAELLHLLADMPRRPMLAGDGDLRLSLAGAQDKLPVVVSGERIGLPLFGSPSTHILKPAIEGIEGSVFNEGFCMALARAMGLDAAPTEIRRVHGQPYLLVQRYDRLPVAQTPATSIQRLHQEDFCQALGMPPELKYQNEGGPDLAQAFALVRSATRPNAPHILKLLGFVLFNTLVGNHDAHAKNFSLLYTPRGAVLAQLYDALSTAVYPELTDKMAMKIGSKYRFAEVHARHWEQFAARRRPVARAGEEANSSASPSACRPKPNRSMTGSRPRATRTRCSARSST